MMSSESIDGSKLIITPVKSMIVLTSAVLATINLVSFLSIPLFLIYAFITNQTKMLTPVIVVWISSGVSYIVTTFFSRCPSCRAHVFIQTHPRDRLHPKRSRFGGIVDGWLAIVVDVLLNRRFRCMKCGQDVGLKIRHNI